MQSKRRDLHGATLINPCDDSGNAELMAEFSDYVWLIGEAAAAYLMALAEDTRSALRQQAQLRREMSAERARLLVEQAALRRRAAAKFGELAQQMYFTPIHLEQATDLCIAGLKASRFMQWGEHLVINDYCCGVGGDMTGLAARGPYVGWDRSKVACLLASANLEVVTPHEGRIRLADVSELTPAPDEAWHVDPDRRAIGARTTNVELHSPIPEVIEQWRRASPRGAVKLAPASEPPAAWAAEAEWEWISSERQCRQLVVWFGELAEAPGLRRATQLIRLGLGGMLGGSITGRPAVSCESTDSPRQYIFDPDPAVLAADLLGELAAKHRFQSLGHGGSYLTGDQLVDEPLLQGFAVQECLPLRAASIRQALASRGVGRVEIKKRGVSVEPEKFRRGLKLHGDAEATILLTRIGKREVAVISDRLPMAAGVNEADVGS
jgi:hypothetical protein